MRSSREVPSSARKKCSSPRLEQAGSTNRASNINITSTAHRNYFITYLHVSPTLFCYTHVNQCFGRNDEGQCGRGNLDESVGSNAEDMGDNLPYVDLGEGVEAISISSGTATTCAALLGGGIK